MKNLLDIVLGLVGVGALAFAVYHFYKFASPPGPEGPTGHLWMAIAGAVVLCVCVLAIVLRHSGAEEEIHITQ